MQIGYARASKINDQDTVAQERALKLAGCDQVHLERASGGRWDRPGLHQVLGELKPGDVLVVWKLDRLSRSLKDMLLILERVEKAGAGFRSLTEAVDTTAPAGRMLMHMLGAFVEFERAMVRERTLAGLDLARSQGRVGGRPHVLSQAQETEIVEAVQSGRRSAADMARVFKVHPSTVLRMLASEGRTIGTGPITSAVKHQLSSMSRNSTRRDRVADPKATFRASDLAVLQGLLQRGETPWND